MIFLLFPIFLNILIVYVGIRAFIWGLRRSGGEIDIESLIMMGNTRRRREKRRK